MVPLVPPEGNRWIRSYPHGKNMLFIVEGMTFCKHGQLGFGPVLHFFTQNQLLLPQLHPHTQVIQVGIGLLRHLQNDAKRLTQMLSM